VVLSIALGLAFAVVALSAIGAYLYSATRAATEHVKHARLMPSEDAGGAIEPDDGKFNRSGNGTGKDASDAPINLLLMGIDGRNPQHGRSDTLMVLHLDADRHAGYLISFPRDMYVPIPGKGKNKINAAYALGGPELAVRSIQDLLQIKINHAAVVDFTGLVDLTDDLGGVTITNRYGFSSHGYRYPAGKITISGDRAMWYVRERFALPHGDLDRAANNRQVVEAVLAKGLSPGAIRNPSRFTRFVGDLAGSITVDNGFTNAEMRRLALSLRMSPDDIRQLQAPISGFADVPGVGAVDVVDQAALGELADAIRSDDLAGYAEAHPGR
jgi:LCP family protein required for cell wall assembly